MQVSSRCFPLPLKQVIFQLLKRHITWEVKGACKDSNISEGPSVEFYCKLGTCLRLAFTLNSVASKIVRKSPRSVHRHTSDFQTIRNHEKVISQGILVSGTN
ncbi:jg8562 [Pararge aegeria aegeria]|uniref:Jg8562 protein n=1 Tax=Pararge aegeria aegeria TaxID=348720 RepID=A0A8S4RJ68_9NEOP|nr:jg8562 [Pararge aegeria aegeria]